MRSNAALYELILTPLQTCQLPAMPNNIMLEQALPGCLCSDLFVHEFSYKPLDLCSGFLSDGDVEYRLLKCLKSARYIHETVRLNLASWERLAQMQSPAERVHPVKRLIRQLRSGDLNLKDGYIGYKREVATCIQPIQLSQGNHLLGIAMPKGSLYHCYVRSDTSSFPDTLLFCDNALALKTVKPMTLTERERYVLQHDLPVVSNWQVGANSSSRFKLGYAPNLGRVVVCAGSVISREDHFGEGVFL